MVIWRAVIENKRGLKISRPKTEFLVPSHQQGVEGEPLPSVNRFKYLGSELDGSGGGGMMSMYE